MNTVSAAPIDLHRVPKAAISSIVLLLAIAGAQSKLSSAGMDRGQSLRLFLQKISHNRDTRYVAAFTDLNGDGQPEAIVYLISPEWCGSGGCSMFILQQNSNG
jgi:hypothetical protein